MITHISIARLQAILATLASYNSNTQPALKLRRAGTDKQYSSADPK